MQEFKINDDIKIICQSLSTRNGFKHTATLYLNSVEVLNTKICYLNRTWESYQFESVINKIKDIATKNKIIDFNLIATENKI